MTPSPFPPPESRASERLRVLIEALRANPVAEVLVADRGRCRMGVGLDGVIVDTTDSVAAVLGLSREELIGAPVSESHILSAQGESGLALPEAIERALAGADGTVEYDAQVVMPGGLTLSLRVRVARVAEADDAGPIGTFVEIEDIGLQYRSREVMREQQRLLHVVFERTLQLIAILGADGEVLDVNDAVEQLGISRRDILGRNVVDVLATTRPDLAETWQARLASLGSRREPDRYFDVIPALGSSVAGVEAARALDISLTPVLAADGSVEMVFVEVRDQTERHEAEERLRASEEQLRAQSEHLEAAAELTGLGTFVWDLRDPEGEVKCDDRYRRIHGLDPSTVPQREWITLWTSHVHAEDRARVTKAGLDAQRPGGPNFNEVYRFRRDTPAGPEERWLACAARVEFAGDGVAERMVGTVQDITLARREDEARVRLQKVEAISTLVSAVAHDFNNVIGAILTYARVADAELDRGESPRESLGEITRGARRAADVLGRLMTFGREEAPRRTPIDLPSIIDEASLLLRPALPSAVRLHTTVADQLPPLDGDSTQIHQVLVNLLTNAAQALGEAGGAIHIRVDGLVLDDTSAQAAAVSPGPFVRIVVADTGPGFDAGVAHRLFDPFFTTKEVGKGTGLGLAAVQSIVRAHHGAVTADALAGGGAAFTVLLPASAPIGPSAASPSAVAQTPAPELVGPPEPPHGSGVPASPRVLFVDDESAFVRLARRAMPRLGLTVIGHIDPRDAARMFATQPEDFDVLVTDLSMPGLTGLELTAELRALRPDLPVVLTSGSLSPADERAAIDAGVGAIVPKPCSMEALASAVHELVAS